MSVEPALHAAEGVTWIIATLVVGCVAAAALIPIDKVVTAQGHITALKATSVVQPLETAIIRSLDVHEGDVVKKGQILARLDPTFAAADFGALQDQVTGLKAEVDRLRAEASGIDYLPTSSAPSAILQGAMLLQRKSERAFKNENYFQKANGLQAQIQRAASDVHAYTERLKVATEVEQKRMELERLQVGSQLNRLTATDSRIEVRRGLDGAEAQVAQAQRELQALEAERAAYNESWRAQVSQDLMEKNQKLSDAQENLKKADLRKQLVELRADQDGVVLNVAKVSAGSVMQSGEQFITLVPNDTPLEAEIDVSGADVGYVHPANVATIKLDTLPYTQYGTLTGTVRVVSPDSFSTTADEQQIKRGSLPTSSRPLGPSYYRAHLTIDAMHLHGTPEEFHLVPGMPITADVKVGKRTILTDLLAHVMPAFKNGMREP